MENNDEAVEAAGFVIISNINGGRENVLEPRLIMMGNRALRLRQNSARIEESISSTFHVVYAFFVATLVGLLQVMYQNKNLSPFETHLTTILTLITSTCTYCLAMVGESLTKNYNVNCSKIFGHVNCMSGAISSVSLTLLFLPSSLSSMITFLVWAIFFAIVAQYLYKTMYVWFYQKIATAVVQVLELYRSFMGQRLMEQQRLPV